MVIFILYLHLYLYLDMHKFYRMCLHLLFVNSSFWILVANLSTKSLFSARRAAHVTRAKTCGGGDVVSACSSWNNKSIHGIGRISRINQLNRINQLKMMSKRQWCRRATMGVWSMWGSMHIYTHIYIYILVILDVYKWIF